MNDLYEAHLVWPPFLPVAPEQAVRASSINTEGGEDWLRSVYAIVAPVIPEPMTTIDALFGKSVVERWLDIALGGSCQHEAVGLGFGVPGGIEARPSIISR